VETSRRDTLSDDELFEWVCGWSCHGRYGESKDDAKRCLHFVWVELSGIEFEDLYSGIKIFLKNLRTNRVYICLKRD